LNYPRPFFSPIQTVYAHQTPATNFSGQKLTELLSLVATLLC
jgi:hypothetical protein